MVTIRLTALAALAVYVIWQSIKTDIQVAGAGPYGIELLELVQHGIAPSLAAAGLFLLAVVLMVLRPVAFVPNLDAAGDQLRNPNQLRRLPLATTAIRGAKFSEALIAAR